jgi:hypothetical protein
MGTTATAALHANVTVATIRAWCRRGVIAATKTAGHWFIDVASLAHRIAIGAMRTRKVKATATDTNALRAELTAINERLTPARNAHPLDRERGARDRASGTLRARAFARNALQILDLADLCDTNDQAAATLDLHLAQAGYVPRSAEYNRTHDAKDRAEALLTLARDAETRIKK